MSDRDKNTKRLIDFARSVDDPGIDEPECHHCEHVGVAIHDRTGKVPNEPRAYLCQHCGSRRWVSREPDPRLLN